MIKLTLKAEPNQARDNLFNGIILFALGMSFAMDLLKDLSVGWLIADAVLAILFLFFLWSDGKIAQEREDLLKECMQHVHSANSLIEHQQSIINRFAAEMGLQQDTYPKFDS